MPLSTLPAMLRPSLVPLYLSLCSLLVGSTICSLIPVAGDSHAQTADAEFTDEPTGDWPQWGGTSVRNNVPVGTNIPDTWDVGDFDRETGEWIPSSGENIRWAARLGSQTYGNPVVAGGKVFVGTNNGAGYLKRYPPDVDLGCLVAFNLEDGRFLWQHSSEKLPTGRVHDWPLQGICCAPLVEGNRLWFVTSRGEVVCLDTEGYYDDRDDGPAKARWLNLFVEATSVHAGLESGSLSAALEALLKDNGLLAKGRLRVSPGDQANQWRIQITDQGKEVAAYDLVMRDDRLILHESSQNEGSDSTPLLDISNDLTEGLSAGRPNATLMALLKERGAELEDAVVQAAEKGWQIQGMMAGSPRTVSLARRGPNLAAMLQSTPDDRYEADEIWVFDMMSELNVSQHNMCSCSVTALGDILFINTSNGVDESHVNIPSVEAPSFIALDKNTGEVLWTDKSPGENIIHGQWSSPTVAEIEGVPQVIFGAGDGWMYGFRADRGRDGSPELLWKFDANPKESIAILGGRGTRNEIIGTPVVYNDRVYVAVGQDPEHGEGIGHLWCIDPTKRGDISAELAVHVSDRLKPIPHRRLQAVIPEEGEVAIDNPNSGVVWHYSEYDLNRDGEIAFEETMHRSCGTVAIQDDLLFVADFSGVFHCLDAKTGKVHWTYDLMSATWGSPLIVEGKVYIGDEDGEVAVFKRSSEPHEPIAENDMRNSVYSTPIVAHNVMYISNKTHLFAIAYDDEDSAELSH